MKIPVFALVDIDGVLADDTHRHEHAAKKTPEGWTEYFSLMWKDPYHPSGQELVQRLEDEKIPFAYLTGRREDTEWMTRTWLTAGGFPQVPLFMRGFYDRTPLGLLKAKYARLLTLTADSVQVHDDDPTVTCACALVPNVYPTLCTWQVKPGHLVGSQTT